MIKVHLKTVFGHIRRAPFQALSAIAILFLTFFVGTIISILIYSSGQLINYFETRPQVIAFLKDGVTAEQVSALQNQLSSDQRLKDVKYVSKEEALSIYKQATIDNPLLAELVSPAIFPASLEFSLKDLSYAQEIIEEVKGEDMVEDVGFTASIGSKKNLHTVVERLRSISYYVRIAGVAFVAFLGATSFFVLVFVISMRMVGRKDEIEILYLIGAKPGFVRIPVILEAVVYSFLGVITGWLAALILVLYSTPSIISYFGNIQILPRNTVELFYLFGIILAIELLVGFFLAVLGSVLAISRAKKVK
jgi:cell division transport system permease protein